jgi:iron complex transport system ATP-binding protein
MNKYTLEFFNIYFSYSRQLVLTDISLKLKQGEFVSIIGPNGTGKSTLIKVAMRLLTPQKGEVKAFGRTLKQWPVREFARYFAMVPQNASLPLTFTVWETVLLGRTPYLNFLGAASHEDKKIVRKALEWVDISHLADRTAGEISGGERQRVILARALAQQPRCLLLDEPTASLDIHHQVTLLSFIKQLAVEKKVTVLAVFHDLNFAATFSDILILLNDGKIVLKGSPREVMGDKQILEVYKHSISITHRTDEKGLPAVLPRLQIKPTQR